MTQDALKRFGALAVQAAERWFARDIYDPNSTDHTPHAQASLAAIREITIANNWPPYRGNDILPRTEWCGMFAFECWAEAGLDRRWLQHFSQSTGRIRLWANYLPFDEHKNVPRPANTSDARIWVDLVKHQDFVIEPGMIVIVGDPTNAKLPHGRHVTLAKAVEGKTIHTISGNGGGLGPDGKHREGVVTADFTIGAHGFSVPMFATFPGFGDLVAERG